MTPERKKILLDAARNRQLDLVVVLENVHDPHNISAVLRTCDAVGVQMLCILLTDPAMHGKKIRMGKRSSAGARKWMQVIRYHDAEKCFADIRQRCTFVYGTGLGEDKPKSYLAMDFTASCALVFGNEHTGITPRVSAMCDSHFIVPQKGMVQSLNISVACGVTLYEAYRQRSRADLYHRTEDAPATVEALRFFRERIASGATGRAVEERF